MAEMAACCDRRAIAVAYIKVHCVTVFRQILSATASACEVQQTADCTIAAGASASAAVAAVPFPLLLLLQVPAGWAMATVAQAVLAQQAACTPSAAPCPCPLALAQGRGCSQGTAQHSMPAGYQSRGKMRRSGAWVLLLRCCWGGCLLRLVLLVGCARGWGRQWWGRAWGWWAVWCCWCVVGTWC